MRKLNGHISIAGTLLLLASCATEHQPTAIETELARSLAEITTNEVRVPDAVTQDLMPPVSTVFEDYNPDDERFDISVQDLEAREFYQALVKDTPFNMVVHPGITGTVTLDLKSVNMTEVMELVREHYGYEYKKSGSLYQVVPGGLQTQIFKINYLNITRRGGSEIQVSAGQVTNSGPSSQGGDSVRGNNSSPDAGSQRGSSGIVGTRITTESDSDFWSDLQRTLSLIVSRGDGQSVVVAPESGIVVVRANPTELRTVEEFLLRTELTMQRQVVLEAKILEVVLNDGHSQGISWSALSEFNDERGADGTVSKFLATNQSGSRVSNPGLDGVFSAALRINDFDALIGLLSTQGTVQVLSSPRIATVNNQKAVIKVGSDEFFVTEIRVDENNNVNSSNSTNTDVELTPFFSGIALDVTPQISDDGRIVLHVHPSISEVDDQTKVVSLGDRDLTLPLALSTIRETDSVISASSGQVVVIGGLISEYSTEDRASVPLLGRIPGLGNMFTQKQVKKRKSELVILIRPIIASPTQMRADLEAAQKRFGQLQGAR